MFPPCSFERTIFTDVVSYEELKQMISDGAVMLFDVREPYEFSNGSIPTSTNIPLGEVQKAFTLSAVVFEETYEMEMPTKDNGSIVVYCRSGKRSLEALNILKGLGYRGVKHWDSHVCTNCERLYSC
uniref:Rhodanese domain-containing protein n=1 Tax=Eptatretus burgeri TaxID=7764 RepID=A0A8C4N9I3_EPTBU